MRVALIFAVFLSTTAHAQKAGSVSRGQGHNPWSFAFAEEQLIKDHNCAGKNCARNGNEWRASIFDIVKAHAQAQRESFSALRTEDGNALLPGQMLFAGSAQNLPFAQLSQNQVRHSDCTLEQPLLRLNRDKNFNPRGLNLYAQLREFYQGLQSLGFKYMFTGEQVLALKSLGVYDALNVASVQFQYSQNVDNFIERVLDVSLCATKVALPSADFGRLNAVSETSVREYLRLLLKDGKSVLVGLCREDLQEIKSEKCTTEAVVVKNLQGKSVTVVDSGFHSKRKANADGSTQFPLEAIIKSAARVGQILEQSRREEGFVRLRAQMIFDQSVEARRQELAKQAAQLSRQASGHRDLVSETMQGIYAVTKSVPVKDMIAVIVSAVVETADHEEVETDGQLIEELANLTIKSRRDLEQIEPLLYASFKRMDSAALAQVTVDQQALKEISTRWPVLDMNANLVWYR